MILKGKKIANKYKLTPNGTYRYTIIDNIMNEQQHCTCYFYKILPFMFFEIIQFIINFIILSQNYHRFFFFFNSKIYII
jgi:hypothetical protein